jgi:predicted nucleic acid-binding Zn ribbon protein
MGQSEDIKNILSRRLKHYGLDKAVTAARVCNVAEKVIGPASSAGDDCEIVSFKNGALKVRAKSVVAAHMLRLRQKGIILKINGDLGEDLVKKIRFEIG